MIVTLNTSALKSLEQIRAFLEGSEPVNLAITDRRQAYVWIAETLKRFRYPSPDKGVLRLYLVKVSGLSRQGTTSLQQRQSGPRDHGADGGDYRWQLGLLHATQFAVIADDIMEVWEV